VAPTPWGTGGTVTRRTANKKLTKLYWPSWKRSPKGLIVEPKKWRGTTLKIYPALRVGSVPLPDFRAGPVPSHFQIRSGATSHYNANKKTSATTLSKFFWLIQGELHIPKLQTWFCATSGATDYSTVISRLMANSACIHCETFATFVFIFNELVRWVCPIPLKSKI